MRDIVTTATFLASIAAVIVLMLMAPKGFGLQTSDPIVQGEVAAE